jgi:hypothetical protein
MTTTPKDYDAASSWAEDEMTLPTNSRTARRGAAAAAHGREMLARAGAGRPALPETDRLAVTQQVRLTTAEKEALQELGDRQNRKPSALAREAIREYLANHTPAA